MPYPSPLEWPAMPSYLQDITQVSGTRTLRFQLKDPTNGHDVDQGFMPSKFYINLQPGELRQYNPACVDITAKLGTAEEWTILNTTNLDPFHVFHIHTNPFQVIQNGGPALTPPYVWQDSITLPASAVKGPVKMRTRFEELTGEYVLHCHFLGHEDRGMMLGVQTVCRDPTRRVLRQAEPDRAGVRAGQLHPRGPTVSVQRDAMRDRAAEAGQYRVGPRRGRALRTRAGSLGDRPRPRARGSLDRGPGTQRRGQDHAPARARRAPRPDSGTVEIPRASRLHPPGSRARSRDDRPRDLWPCWPRSTACRGRTGRSGSPGSPTPSAPRSTCRVPWPSGRAG